jgi:L-threonylcarbamoyladenylate synthase
MSYFTDSFDKKVITLLRQGAVGFMPADTIYGLSCLALNEQSVEKVNKLKKREGFKPFVVLIADIEQAAELGLNMADLEIVRKIWPAPLTFVCPAGTTTPEFLHRGMKSLAVRVPANKPLLELLQKTGPLISTSANTSGKDVAQNAEGAQKYFGDKLDFYIDIGELNDLPSTLVQIKNGKLVVLRQGTHTIK